jgi:hypothetical protein
MTFRPDIVGSYQPNCGVQPVSLPLARFDYRLAVQAQTVAAFETICHFSAEPRHPPAQRRVVRLQLPHERLRPAKAAMIRRTSGPEIILELLHQEIE